MQKLIRPHHPQKPTEETKKQFKNQNKNSHNPSKRLLLLKKQAIKTTYLDSVKTNPFAETTKQSSSTSSKPKQSFEFTTLTNISKTQPRESLI